LAQKTLLSIIELGGYPDFRSIYESHGYAVTVINQMRKALRFLKQQQPDVIVAEFNFQSDFRDRSSNLESILALLQRHPNSRVIVFYDREFEPQFQSLQERFSIHHSQAFPVTEPDAEKFMQTL
jgi:CheY-like chemotaxis protein